MLNVCSLVASFIEKLTLAYVTYITIISIFNFFIDFEDDPSPLNDS
ncbi:19803_t:CDS:2 [Entrophospora sp. SA101]|nr:19803_t:CDS:2 [Entrophospora sp. SA101]